MNQFIVLEGLSGAGKTTIAKAVAEAINAHFYKTPPSLFCLMREEIDRSADGISRFLFYLAGVFYASQEIVEILKYQPVVCDRYILTTLCYHRAINVIVDIPKSFFQTIVQPSHTFLVVCDNHKRITRLEGRGLTQNDMAERRTGVEERFLNEYRAHCPTEIDNSADDPRVAVEKILSVLRG